MEVHDIPERDEFMKRSLDGGAPGGFRADRRHHEFFCNRFALRDIGWHVVSKDFFNQRAVHLDEVFRLDLCERHAAGLDIEVFFIFHGGIASAGKDIRRIRPVLDRQCCDRFERHVFRLLSLFTVTIP